MAGRARVDIKEFDYTTSIEIDNSIPVAIVGFAQSGPIEVPTLITNSQQFESIFGSIGWENDTNYAYGPYAADFFLEEGNTLYYVRGDITGSQWAYMDVLSGTISTGASAVTSDTMPAFFTAGTGVSSSATRPTGSSYLRLYAKYKGDYANGAYNIIIANKGFFDLQYADITGGNFYGPNLNYRPSVNDELYIGVYTSAGVLVEEFVTSLLQKKDTQGNNMFIEDVINSNSNIIAAKVNISLTAAGVVTSGNTVGGIDYNDFVSGGGTYSQFLSGDHNAVSGGAYSIASATWAQLGTATSALNNSNDLIIRVFAVPGAANSSMASTIETVANNRKDCVGIVDLPRGTVSDIVSARYAYGINSTYIATYANWFNYYDGRNDKFIYLPPSIQVLPAFARTYNNYGVFYAPAGKTRGILKYVENMDIKFTDGELDILTINQINPLVKLRYEGDVIWGQKTTYSFLSDFQDINIRNLFINIEQDISKFARTLIFEFNDARNRNHAKRVIDGYLEGVKNRGGIIDFAVVCDSSNNTDAILANHEFVIDIFVKATKIAEIIKLNFIATRDLVIINRD